MHLQHGFIDLRDKLQIKIDKKIWINLIQNILLYREISWKEFVNGYLQRGKVDRLVVVNNKWVRIQLMDGMAENQTLWFAIGSPDTFERNLENAQIDSGTEPANFTPVIYR